MILIKSAYEEQNKKMNLFCLFVENLPASALSFKWERNANPIGLAYK
jgi:hypothetical protein